MEEGAIAIAIAIVIAIAGVAIVAIHTATTVLGADVAGVGEAEAGVAKYSIMLLKVYFHSKFTWLVDDPHTHFTPSALPATTMECSAQPRRQQTHLRRSTSPLRRRRNAKAWILARSRGWRREHA